MGSLGEGVKVGETTLEVAAEVLVFEYVVDAGQSPVMKPLEDFPFKDEAFAVSFVWVDRLFESKEIFPDLLVSDQVDCSKSPGPKETLYHITASGGVLYGSSNRESRKFLLHAAPYQQRDRLLPIL
jgi:hypothetical protein